jgi:cytochrome c biogenesis protein CcdA/thiol-disulfide isomerase/thioredoxin
MLILTFFAFIAGVVTVLSPCILPVLPIILSGSVGEGKQRPLGVVAGFVCSFTFFTLFLSTLVQFTGISADVLRSGSVATIIIFGIALLTPKVQGVLEQLFSFFTRFSPKQQKEGFLGGFVLGLSLGLIWTPCVGPILASVISLALSGSVTTTAFFITLAYSLGTSLPMLAVIYGGRKLLQKVPWLFANTEKIQKAFGVVMIAVGIAMMFNLDRQFQTWVLATFPTYGVGLTKIEEQQVVKTELERLSTNESSTQDEMGKPSFELLESANYKLAPELDGGTAWVNSEPLKLSAELKGKVVLIDFWTYSCINCIRTFPYLTQWYESYKDKGFVIIGVHAPEFEFEKNQANVKQAMKDFRITYPVVQDNEFKIWRAYQNQYWPAHYLIDKDGRVRYTHFGEGKYQETENKIRELLGESPMEVTNQFEGALTRPQTHETYLGHLRADAYPLQLKVEPDVTKQYSYTGLLADDAVVLNGAWNVQKEYAVSEASSSTTSLNFLAQKVHLVLSGKEDRSYLVRVLLDGEPVPKKYWTSDMNERGEIVVDEARKYDIINLGEDYGRYTIDLQFPAGVEAYAFTFGS